MTSVDSILYSVYRVHDNPGFRSTLPTDALPGLDGESYADRKLESAMVQAVIHNSLFDYLFDLIGCLYSDDPAYLTKTVSHVQEKTGIRREAIAWEIEKYKLSLKLDERPSKTQQVISQWHAFATDILEDVFEERGLLTPSAK